MKKTIILDTNVYLTEAGSILAFGKNNIAIPTIVLDEIDKLVHKIAEAEEKLKIIQEFKV